MINDTFFAFGYVIGGLAILLYGLSILSDNALKLFRLFLKRSLYDLGQLPFKGFFLGGIFSIVLLSAPLISIVLSFVNAGLVSFYQSLPVILGANVGTTIFMQIIAYPIGEIAFLILGIGFIVGNFFQNEKVSSAGFLVFGLGLSFLGMKIMTDGALLTSDIKFFHSFITFLLGKDLIGVWIVILISILVTAFLKRSAATITVLFAFMSAGVVVDFEIYFGILLGAHIGTTFIPILMTRGTDKETQMSAIAHLVFNVFGAFLAMTMFSFYYDFSLIFESNKLLQVATVNTLIQMVNALICLCLFPILKRLIKIPIERRQTHLHYKLLNTPEQAIVALLAELKTMAKVARSIFHKSIKGNFEFDYDNYYILKKEEEVLDTLKQRVVDFIHLLAERKLSSRQSILTQYLITVTDDLERMGDHADKLAEITREKGLRNIKFSEEGKMDLMELYKMIDDIFQLIVDSLNPKEQKGPSETSQKILDKRNAFMEIRVQVKTRYNQRMIEQKESVLAAIYFNRYLDSFTKLVKHSKTIALVERKPFFFVKTKKLQDKCEGVINFRKIKRPRVEYDKDFFKRH